MINEKTQTFILQVKKNLSVSQIYSPYFSFL